MQIMAWRKFTKQHMQLTSFTISAEESRGTNTFEVSSVLVDTSAPIVTWLTISVTRQFWWIWREVENVVVHVTLHYHLLNPHSPMALQHISTVNCRILPYFWQLVMVALAGQELPAAAKQVSTVLYIIESSPLVDIALTKWEHDMKVLL